MPPLDYCEHGVPLDETCEECDALPPDDDMEEDEDEDEDDFEDFEDQEG